MNCHTCSWMQILFQCMYANYSKESRKNTFYLWLDKPSFRQSSYYPVRGGRHMITGFHITFREEYNMTLGDSVYDFVVNIYVQINQLNLFNSKHIQTDMIFILKLGQQLSVTPVNKKYLWDSNKHLNVEEVNRSWFLFLLMRAGIAEMHVIQ